MFCWCTPRWEWLFFVLLGIADLASDYWMNLAALSVPPPPSTTLAPGQTLKPTTTHWANCRTPQQVGCRRPTPQWLQDLQGDNYYRVIGLLGSIGIVFTVISTLMRVHKYVYFDRCDEDTMRERMEEDRDQGKGIVRVRMCLGFSQLLEYCNICPICCCPFLLFARSYDDVFSAEAWTLENYMLLVENIYVQIFIMFEDVPEGIIAVTLIGLLRNEFGGAKEDLVTSALISLAISFYSSFFAFNYERYKLNPFGCVALTKLDICPCCQQECCPCYAGVADYKWKFSYNYCCKCGMVYPPLEEEYRNYEANGCWCCCCPDHQADVPKPDHDIARTGTGQVELHVQSEEYPDYPDLEGRGL